MKNEKIITTLQWELHRRRIQENGFVPFCNAFGYELSHHHMVMAQKLERAATEDGYCLIICMPPGHAKSRYASILFPSYYLGMFPGKSVVMASHTAELSAKWGRSCKRLIDDEKYKFMMGVTLNKDSQSSDRFDLSNGSEYFACGVGGAVTGHRADLGIIDDPVRSKEDADSERVREKIWEWYLNDFCTRSKPNASKIIIMTRWHEDDLVGRILLSPDKDNWDVLSLPALAEPNDALGRAPGEALWPCYISYEMLSKIKQTTDARTWNSLYQQNPSADEGNYFKAEWIQTTDHAPKGLTYYIASDYAVSANRGDYTVHVVVGHDPKTDNLYVVDLWRGREETNVWVDKLIDLCLTYKPSMVAEESGQIIKSLNPFIEKEMVRRRCFAYRQQFTSVHDKTVRARSFQAYMTQKRVFILNREWTDDLLLELLKFPTGRNDDQCDALGLIGRMLEEMVMKVEKSRQKVEYVYKSNTLVLPSLNDKINNHNNGIYRKF